MLVCAKKTQLNYLLPMLLAAVSAIPKANAGCGNISPNFTYTLNKTCGLPVQVKITNTSTGWVRLRWTVSYTNVDRIFLQFDEGQDAAGGPDMFGAAFLDNVDVNGTLVGQG